MSSKLSPRPHIDDFIVVWIVEHDNAENTHEFDRATNSIKTFNDTNKCVEYIRDAKNENIFLVISNSFTEKVVPQVHALHQLSSIYIVSSKTSPEDAEYNTSYVKVKGVFPNIVIVCEHLRQEMRVVEENATPISIISSATTSSKDPNTLDPSFMYSQLLKEILFELRYNQQARNRFIEFCREQYADNVRELGII